MTYGITELVGDIACGSETICNILNGILSAVKFVVSYSTEIFIVVFAILMTISTISMYFYMRQPNERKGREMQFDK